MSTSEKHTSWTVRHDFGWDSGFYRFAETIRSLTSGACNHKHIYSLVGTKGRYVNHASPAVRKRTAAALSRLTHSSRYAADFRKSYAEDSSVFSRGATGLVNMLHECSDLDDAGLYTYLLDRSWPELRTGLESEARGGRDIDCRRLAFESDAVERWGAEQLALGRAPLAEFIAACFRTMAFGCLDDRFARTLCSRTPKSLDGIDPPRDAADPAAACLVRISGGEAEPSLAPISGVWRVDAAQPFSIGRFSSCDVIEADPAVSRLHCRVYALEGSWYLEDGGSRHGTQVLRGRLGSAPTVVFDSATESVPCAFRLKFGDRIVLAGRVTYWFCALDAYALAIGPDSPKPMMTRRPTAL